MASLTSQMRDELLTEVKKYKKGLSGMAASWALSASACTAIVEKKLYLAAQYSNWPDYFEQVLNISSSEVKKLIAAYKEFGETPVASLSYRRILYLLTAPQELRNELKKNSKALEKIKKTSDIDLKVRVEEARAQAAASGGASSPAKKAQGFYEGVQQNEKQQQKNAGLVHKAHIEQEQVLKEFKASLLSFEAMTDYLISFTHRLGDAQFAAQLLDEKVIEKVQELMHLLYTPMQHLAVGSGHIKKVVHAIQEKIHREGEHMDVRSYLDNFQKDVKEIQSALGSLDGLASKRQKVSKSNVVHLPLAKGA